MRVPLRDLVVKNDTRTLPFLFLLCLVYTGNGGPAVAQEKQDEINNQAIVALNKRLEQLEGQMADIQVVLGTLQTLAQGQRSVPASSAGFSEQTGAGNTNDQARIAALETQVRALSQRVQQLDGSAGNPGPATLEPQARQPDSQNAWPNNAAIPSDTVPSDTVGSFGETTVNPSGQTTPTGQTTIDNFIQKNLPELQENRENNANLADPKTEYEAAYGLLLQQDYDEAQRAFAEFVKNHPNNTLAGNAQYWLGDTYYLKGQYEEAAKAFLKGYRTYSSSAKAPDSLLKLAMSLDRLNQRAAACASLNEIGQKYPQAPQHLQLRTEQEIRRLRC